MLHGNPTWSFYYRNLVKTLSSRYRCIVPDHIGCGLSDKPGDDRYDYRLKSRIEDIGTLVDSLDHGIDPGMFSQEVDRLRADIESGTLTNAPTDQTLEVDMEMIDLTANVLQYRAVLDAQSKRGDILRAAIRERSAM